jgi:hypothetical protein
MPTIITLNPLLAAAIFIAGIASAAFGIVGTILSIFLTIPTTLKHMKLNAFVNNSPLKHELVGLIIELIVFFFISFIVIFFFPLYQVVYWVGVIITVIVMYDKLKPDKEDLARWFKRNEPFFTASFLNNTKK